MFLSLLQPATKDRILSIKRFKLSQKQHPPKQLFIQLVDGRETHGGLADRVKGMVSAYCLANVKGMEFRIKHTFPFKWEDYLQPNKVDWLLKKEDGYSENMFESTIMHITDFDNGIERFARLNSNTQLHCYTRDDILANINEQFHTDYQWGAVFNLLFKPTDLLRKQIDLAQSKIGGKYITVVFRFQNLLGDFVEYKYPSLDSEAKRILMEKCKNGLISLTQKYRSDQRILVTSDSVTFQKFILDIENVYTFPQKAVHMDNIDGEAFEVYQKAFVDFYMIAESTEVISLGTEIMYKTNFPNYAAKINNIPFTRILID